MDPAHANLPVEDWPEAAAARSTERPSVPAREECVVAPAPTVPVDPNAPVDSVDPNAPVPADPPNPAEPAGIVAGRSATVVESTVPPTTAPPVVVERVGTTIAPDNLDPLAPLPTIELSKMIGKCTAAVTGDVRPDLAHWSPMTTPTSSLAAQLVELQRIDTLADQLRAQRERTPLRAALAEETAASSDRGNAARQASRPGSLLSKPRSRTTRSVAPRSPATSSG